MSDCKSCSNVLDEARKQTELLNQILCELKNQSQQAAAANVRLIQAMMAIKTDVGRFVDDALDDDK